MDYWVFEDRLNKRLRIHGGPWRGVGARPQRNSSFVNMAMAPLQRGFPFGPPRSSTCAPPKGVRYGFNGPNPPPPRVTARRSALGGL
jgi:hypothetical protein